MRIVRIKPGGVEYIHIEVGGVPYDAAPMEVSFDDDETWTEATWNDSRTEIKVLIGGPLGTSSEPFVQLSAGTHEFSVRLVDTPETVIRDTGSVIEVR